MICVERRGWLRTPGLSHSVFYSKVTGNLECSYEVCESLFGMEAEVRYLVRETKTWGVLLSLTLSSEGNSSEELLTKIMDKLSQTYKDFWRDDLEGYETVESDGSFYFKDEGFRIMFQDVDEEPFERVNILETLYVALDNAFDLYRYRNDILD